MPSAVVQLYRQALELNPSPKIAVGILRKLEGIREFPALVLAGRYLDDEATAIFGEGFSSSAWR